MSASLRSTYFEARRWNFSLRPHLHEMAFLSKRKMGVSVYFSWLGVYLSVTREWLR